MQQASTLQRTYFVLRLSEDVMLRDSLRHAMLGEIDAANLCADVCRSLATEANRLEREIEDREIGKSVIRSGRLARIDPTEISPIVREPRPQPARGSRLRGLLVRLALTPSSW